jgi:predicted RNA-binding Zn-ribbon protein involved in translation (DUF1610 family)
MRAYGGCIEPGGWELDDERYVTPCPKCGKPADAWRVEKAEGSLNVYTGIRCDHCGYERGDHPGDNG